MQQGEEVTGGRWGERRMAVGKLSATAELHPRSSPACHQSVVEGARVERHLEGRWWGDGGREQGRRGEERRGEG
jgi:hypothetical protein